MRSMAVGHIENQPFVSQLVVEIFAYLRHQEWISCFIRVAVVILNTLPVIFCAIIGVIAERHNAVVKITFPFILLML